MLRDKERLFIPPLLTIASFIILFIFRAWDDNRLTSWHWVFEHVDPVKVFFVLTAGSVFVMVFVGLAGWRWFTDYPTTLSSGVSADLRFPVVVHASRLCPFVIFIVYFIAGMFFWNMPEVNIDASRYFTQAKHLELFGVRFFLSEWGRHIHAWTDMPLVPFLYGVIFRYFGESRVYIQIFTTSLFALTGVLTYKTGQTLWDKETGIYGSAFLLCIPYLYTQIPLMLVDVPAMFFLMLSIFALIKALKCGGIWLVFSSLAIFLTFLAKYSAGLMLSVLPVLTIVFAFGNEAPGKRTCIVRAVCTASMACLLLGLFIFANYPVVREQIQLLMSYQKPALQRWEESFSSTFLFQTHLFLTFFSFVSVYVAIKRKDWKYLIILWLVLLVILLQIRRIRYVIMVFPLLALMAAYGLRSLKSMETRIITVSCAVISSFVLAVTAYLPFLQELSMVNLKKAGEFLDTRSSSLIEVHVVQPVDPAGSLFVAVPIMDLFTRKNLIVDERIPVGQNAEAGGLSPLRFTWEFKNPSYYRNAGISTKIDTVAVISDSAVTQFPSYLEARLTGFQLVKSFDKYEGIFRFRTSVSIYEKRGDDQNL
jgi:hypothetical protein